MSDARLTNKGYFNKERKMSRRLTEVNDVAKYKMQFMTVVLDFITELHIKFPDDPVLAVATTMDKYVNSAQVIGNFCKYILPYDELIAEKKEKYFIDMEMTGIYNEEDFDIDKDEFKFRVTYVKKIWRRDDVTERTKEAIWSYMILLCKLARKYMDVKNNGDNEVRLKGEITRNKPKSKENGRHRHHRV